MRPPRLTATPISCSSARLIPSVSHADYSENWITAPKGPWEARDQRVFSATGFMNEFEPLDWNSIEQQADRFEKLDVPHRWDDGCRVLGDWILSARAALKSGGKVDLRSGRPPSLSIIHADNNAQRNLEYRPAAHHRRPIDEFDSSSESLLMLSRHNDATLSLRAAFNRRIPLWEVTATAHKLARIVYHLLSTKQPYNESLLVQCDR